MVINYAFSWAGQIRAMKKIVAEIGWISMKRMPHLLKFSCDEPAPSIGIEVSTELSALGTPKQIRGHAAVFV